MPKYLDGTALDNHETLAELLARGVRVVVACPERDRDNYRSCQVMSISAVTHEGSYYICESYFAEPGHTVHGWGGHSPTRSSNPAGYLYPEGITWTTEDRRYVIGETLVVHTQTQRASYDRQMAEIRAREAERSADAEVS